VLHRAASRWVTAAVTEDLADEYDHVLVTGLEGGILGFFFGLDAGGVLMAGRIAPIVSGIPATR
jgi:hypothetical protein